MRNDRLIVMLTPSATGLAWRAALIDHVTRLGWATMDIGPSGLPDDASGLLFAYSHSVLSGCSEAAVVLIDTTAVNESDPGRVADQAELAARSHTLVEADAAARSGALVLNGARYRLDFPIIGMVERSEGARYRIPPEAHNSPLALFDALPIPAGASAAWEPRWFTYPTRPDTAVEGRWIDMTGRMRPLVYGPYVRLPAGRWCAEARFAVDPERGHSPLLFEWGAGTEFCRIMAEVRQPGTYSIKLDRIWPEPDAAQLRIWNYHPVFEGKLDFLGCTVSSVPDNDPNPPTPTDRIVELGIV